LASPRAAFADGCDGASVEMATAFGSDWVFHRGLVSVPRAGVDRGSALDAADEPRPAAGGADGISHPRRAAGRVELAGNGRDAGRVRGPVPRRVAAERVDPADSDGHGPDVYGDGAGADHSVRGGVSKGAGVGAGRAWRGDRGDRRGDAGA